MFNQGKNNINQEARHGNGASRAKKFQDPNDYEYIKSMKWKRLPSEATMKLIHAVKTNSFHLVEVALSEGAVPWTRLPNGKTPLIIACERLEADERIVRKLLSSGAKSKLKDLEGLTAEDYAEHNHRHDLLEIMFSFNVPKRTTKDRE